MGNLLIIFCITSYHNKTSYSKRYRRFCVFNIAVLERWLLLDLGVPLRLRLLRTILVAVANSKWESLDRASGITSNLKLHLTRCCFNPCALPYHRVRREAVPEIQGRDLGTVSQF